MRPRAPRPRRASATSPTGVRLATAGDDAAIRVRLAAAPELDALPAPLDISPADDDERYVLTVDAGGVTVRSAGEAGAARA